MSDDDSIIALPESHGFVRMESEGDSNCTAAVVLFFAGW